MRDLDIRKALHNEVLREFHEDTESRVLDELSLCSGSTRVDIAVINGSLHGFEIKSDRDTLERLPTQIELYSRVLDYATLVVGLPHLKHARKFLPPWWGVMIAKPGPANSPHFNFKRKARRNPSPDPFALVQLLWRREALSILEAHGLAKGLTSKPRIILWEVLATSFSYTELSWMVRQALKIRQGWREGDVEPEPVVSYSDLLGSLPNLLSTPS